jgi:hypothetical protein
MLVRRGWAVVVRDYTPIGENDADVVSVVKVFLSEANAHAEVMRLRAADPSEDKLYYYEETEIEGD